MDSQIYYALITIKYSVVAVVVKDSLVLVDILKYIAVLELFPPPHVCI